MSGSRLGRGRGARLALYGCMLIIFVIIVYLYRAASIEMTRLHELHVQCAHQQEALAAQLQVIYEYKVRVEKSLQEEKNSNQALKQELQQRASREKSLRDKDNEEIVQRYNAMQQKYNILQSENKDLQEECDKRQKLALEETNKLEFTLRNLRNDISRAQEDKKASMESLKNKHAQLKADYDKLDSEHNNLVKNSANWKSNILHLEKEVFQLKRELEQAKKSITSADYNVINPPASQHQKEMNQDKSRAHSANEQVARPSQQQQQISGKSIPGANVESSTKASVASVSPEKSSLAAGKTKVKLPLGVVPIPIIIDPKLENEEKKRDETRRNQEANQNSLVRDAVLEDGSMEKAIAVDIGNLDLQPHLPAGNKHRGQVLDRQGNGGWPKVQHGVQEIGDEPNHLGRLAGLDDAGHQGADMGDDQYDNEEFYREQQPKNNDLRIEEEEDEAGDEDDQPDYPNNLKAEKHK